MLVVSQKSRSQSNIFRELTQARPKMVFSMIISVETSLEQTFDFIITKSFSKLSCHLLVAAQKDGA